MTITRTPRKRLLAGAFAGIAILGGFGFSSIADAGDPKKMTGRPPPLPGIRPDGTVDFDKMPDYFPVADENGNPRRNPDGSVVMRKVFKPNRGDPRPPPCPANRPAVGESCIITEPGPGTP